jgi:hypothetical protein
MVGTAAATFVGLLFVSFSINADVTAGPDDVGARQLATQTFANFLPVLLLAVLC